MHHVCWWLKTFSLLLSLNHVRRKKKEKKGSKKFMKKNPEKNLFFFIGNRYLIFTCTKKVFIIVDQTFDIRFLCSRNKSANIYCFSKDTFIKIFFCNLLEKCFSFSFLLLRMFQSLIFSFG